MEYPKYKETTDAEKFAYGVKQVAYDTHLLKVRTKYYNEWLERLMFEDGSTLSAKELLNYVGFNL